MHIICTVDYNLALFSYTGKNMRKNWGIVTNQIYWNKYVHSHKTWRMLLQTELYYIILHNNTIIGWNSLQLPIADIMEINKIM